MVLGALTKMKTRASSVARRARNHVDEKHDDKFSYLNSDQQQKYKGRNQILSGADYYEEQDLKQKLKEKLYNETKN